MRATATLVDPKAAKAAVERAEEERIRAREKLAEKQSRAMRKYGGGGGYGSSMMHRAPQHLNAGACARVWGGGFGCGWQDAR